MTAERHIRVLPDHVANKIAAGEVVGRPSSVLKELVENALDAGARQIDVEISAGGHKLVSVSDDGSGMGRDDALLSIERHATSKIWDIKDLDTIATLGFRGEALAAISAVSQFTLITRQREASAGTEVSVTGGKVQEVRDTGCPPGTSVQVRNLFFNVPARRKFLRSEQTEFSHLRQMFVELALSHPEAGLRLVSDGREIYRLAGASSREDRLRDLYGADLVYSLKPIKMDNGILKVEGYVGLPDVSRTDRSEQHVFINGRAASAPVISNAISEACRTMFQKGRHAAVFLYITMDPASVDVNVHPAKKEVRLRQPTQVRDMLILAIRNALSLDISAPAAVNQLTWKRPPEAPPRARDTAELFPKTTPTAVRPLPYPQTPPVAPVHPVSKPSVEPVPNPAQEPKPSSDKSPWAWCRILGKIGGRYVALETEEGLVLLDPQAAHERVLYERLMAEVMNRKVSSQALLTPETVELPPRDAIRVRNNLDSLKRMGFGVSEFGQDTFMVDALPAYLSDAQPRALLTGVAEGLEQGGSRSGIERWVEETIAQAACRAAVKSHALLSDAEIEQLVHDLAHSEMPYTCPHGRPTVIFFGLDELNRKFGRT
jgi:DNA mismatch repair protein MutL